MHAFNKTSSCFKTKPTRRMNHSPPLHFGSFMGVLLATTIVFALVTHLSAQDEETQLWQGVLDVGPAKLTLNLQIEPGQGEEKSNRICPCG